MRVLVSDPATRERERIPAHKTKGNEEKTVQNEYRKIQGASQRSSSSCRSLPAKKLPRKLLPSAIRSCKRGWLKTTRTYSKQRRTWRTFGMASAKNREISFRR